MIIGKHKTALTFSGLFVLLIIILATISNVWPRQENWFIELGLLGKNKTAASYFSNVDSTLKIGDQSSWFIYVHNHMGVVQNISVRVKLVNSTLALPNDLKNEPSPYVSFIEFPLLLSDNETGLIPFVWSIQDIINQNDSIVIKSLIVNGETVDVDVPAISPFSYYITFELWISELFSHQYTFDWMSEKGLTSASLHIGFKVVLSEH